MERVEDLEFEVEGDKGFSECSSGCQSGWTLYLCQSQDSPTTSLPPTGDVVYVHEDEEEDLSMLSDASSGPPNVKEDDCINFYYCSNHGDGSKRRKVEEELRQKESRQQHSSFLDDTASSPLLCFSKEDALELSCGFSANHFKVPIPPQFSFSSTAFYSALPTQRKAALQRHSSVPLNPAPVSMFAISTANGEEDGSTVSVCNQEGEKTLL